ncbi:unnamed protein product, partial [Clonostachys rhizophaga]
MAKQGQICTSASHFMTQRSVYDKVVAGLVERAKATLGLGLQVVSKAQYERGIPYRKKRNQEDVTVGLEWKPCQSSKGKADNAAYDLGTVMFTQDIKGAQPVSRKSKLE